MQVASSDAYNVTPLFDRENTYNEFIRKGNDFDVSPGYLDAIGFHEDWRRRFAKVLASNASSKL
jgi:hypothetical protein